jgi:hypothetical protein
VSLLLVTKSDFLQQSHFAWIQLQIIMKNSMHGRPNAADQAAAIRFDSLAIFYEIRTPAHVHDSFQTLRHLAQTVGENGE